MTAETRDGSADAVATCASCRHYDDSATQAERSNDFQCGHCLLWPTPVFKQARDRCGQHQPADSE